jgi:hypothetical protein
MKMKDQKNGTAIKYYEKQKRGREGRREGERD